MMKRTYVVSKDEKSGLWYAHKVGFPWIPVWGSFSKSKRAAQKVAANCMALPIKRIFAAKIKFFTYQLIGRIWLKDKKTGREFR